MHARMMQPLRGAHRDSERCNESACPMQRPGLAWRPHAVVHHRKLDTWPPLGAHIELDEDPEQAALREAREASGLEVELVGERAPTTGPGRRALIAPRFLDIHRISDTHEHIGMIYFARVRRGTTTLAAEEHHDIRWCSADDLDALVPPMSAAVQWYCRTALRELEAD